MGLHQRKRVELCRVLRQHGPLTIRQLCSILRVKDAPARNRIGILVRDGLAHVSKRGRPMEYALTALGEQVAGPVEHEELRRALGPDLSRTLSALLWRG